MTTNNELKEKLAWTFASQEVEFANVFALQCSYLSLKMDGVTQMSKDMLSFIWNGSDSGTWIFFYKVVNAFTIYVLSSLNIVMFFT